MGTPRNRLDEAVIRGKLASLPSWDLCEGKLHRDYRFPDFTTAFAFMTAVAIEAEKFNHHPDWSNAYSSVSVDLSTHDAGGVTELDFKLAARMEELAAGRTTS